MNVAGFWNVMMVGGVDCMIIEWAAVIVSGVFELLGAAGILWRPTRCLAGLGLMALTVAVTPAHIYMLQQPELFEVPIWALWLRLPIQAGLVWLN